MSFFKKEKTVDASEFVKKVSFVFADFEARQPSSTQFLLFGTVDFNEVELPLSSGSIRVRFSGAEVVAECENCQFDMDSIAFRKRGADTAREQVAYSAECETSDNAGLRTNLKAKASLMTPPDISLSAEGKIGAETASREQLKTDVISEKKSYFVEANIIDGPKKVIWRIKPDPSDRYEIVELASGKGSKVACLNGMRLSEADNGLGCVIFDGDDHAVRLSLRARKSDIQITEFELDEDKSLTDLLGNRIVDQKKRLVTDLVIKKYIVQLLRQGRLLANLSVGDE